MALVSNPKDGDDVSIRQAIARLGSSKLGPTSTPTFAGVTTTTLTISGLTTNSLIYPVAGLLTSLGAATNGQIPIGSTGVVPVLALITGTANQITSTPGAGTITLSTPQDIHTGASPTWVGTTWTGKLDGGSQAAPIDVTATREYGLEFHYSGNNYNVTGIRSRAQLVTTDTTATALGGLFQAANNDNINAGVLMGFMAEAVGKSTANASTITTMRGGLIGTEWGALDTVTNLKTLHLRGHSLNAAGAGSFGTGYALYIENEAVGGNGQAYDAGIYFKGTNLSAGNKAFDYGIDFSGADYTSACMKVATAPIGIDFSGGTFATAVQNWSANPVIQISGVPAIVYDNTNTGMFLGTSSFFNDHGSNNLGVGYQSGYNNDTTGAGVEGTNNVYLGYKAGYGATGGTKNTGSGNVNVGYASGYYNTSGSDNFFCGYAAGFSNTTGKEQVFIGAYAGTNKQGGVNNVAIGYYSGRGSAAGTSHRNVTIGHSTGRSISTGGNNTIIGNWSGYYPSTINRCIYLGNYAGFRQTTVNDVFIVYNQDAGSEANEITNSLLYGIMAPAPADQSLRINAGTFILGNPTHADTEGAGAVLIQGIREDGAGTASIAGQISISHDGTGANDTKGKIILATDSGAGLVTALTIDSAQNVIVGDGTNQAVISHTGVLTLEGTARRWQSQDLKPGYIKHPAASPPDSVEYQNRTFDAYDDTAEEQVFYIWHLPNNYAAGTASVRGHFGGMVSNEAGAEYVAMGFEYWHFEVGETYDTSGAADGGGSVNITIANAEGNYVWHESGTGVVDTTGWTNGITVFRFFRDVDGTYTGGDGEAEDDDYTGDALIGVYHLEYLRDSLGSS